MHPSFLPGRRARGPRAACRGARGRRGRRGLRALRTLTLSRASHDCDPVLNVAQACVRHPRKSRHAWREQGSRGRGHKRAPSAPQPRLAGPRRHSTLVQHNKRHILVKQLMELGMMWFEVLRRTEATQPRQPPGPSFLAARDSLGAAPALSTCGAACSMVDKRKLPWAFEVFC